MATDIQKLISEIATRNHILVDRDDPVFAVSTINRYMLDEATERLFERVQVVIKAFEISARAVETHAGQTMAEEMRTLISACKA
jgi:dihydropteroate synthase